MTQPNKLEDAFFGLFAVMLSAVFLCVAIAAITGTLLFVVYCFGLMGLP